MAVKKSTRKKKAAAARKPAEKVESNPEIEALVKQKRFDWEASRAFIQERVRAQEVRLRRIREEALKADPLRVRVTPAD